MSHDPVAIHLATSLGALQRADVALALSTSGKSADILAALCLAREHGLVTVGFTGNRGRICAHHAIIFLSRQAVTRR